MFVVCRCRQGWVNGAIPPASSTFVRMTVAPHHARRVSTRSEKVARNRDQIARSLTVSFHSSVASACAIQIHRLPEMELTVDVGARQPPTRPRLGHCKIDPLGRKRTGQLPQGLLGRTRADENAEGRSSIEHHHHHHRRLNCAGQCCLLNADRSATAQNIRRKKEKTRV